MTIDTTTHKIFGQYILPDNTITELGVYENMTLDEAVSGELEFLNGMPGIIRPFELEWEGNPNEFTYEKVYSATFSIVDEDGELTKDTEDAYFRVVAEEL